MAPRALAWRLALRVRIVVLQQKRRTLARTPTHQLAAFATLSIVKVLAAGTLAGTLVSAAAGAAGGAVLGGAAGAIVGAADGADDDETAAYYRDRIDTGYAMVSVNVDDSQRDEVVGILDAAGAHRVDSYGDGNWH